jgi:hypothetical protein
MDELAELLGTAVMLLRTCFTTDKGTFAVVAALSLLDSSSSTSGVDALVALGVATELGMGLRPVLTSDSPVVYSD